jgi:putative tryptophan/tyrosine transport system ATP-binding protein
MDYDLPFSIRNLSVEYNFGKLDPVAALKSINIESIDKQSILLICGPNGAGKSTLLKSLTGTVSASTGSLHFNGAGPAYSPPVLHRYCKVAFIPQRATAGLVQDMLVDEALLSRTVLLSGCSLKASYTESAKRQMMGEISAISTAVDNGALAFLGQAMKRAVRTLSGGQQQVVNILSALLSPSQVLLLDEPTAKLDDAHKDMVWRLIGHSRSIGKTTILVSHDRLEARKIATREIELNCGQVTYDGKPRP